MSDFETKNCGAADADESRDRPRPLRTQGEDARAHGLPVLMKGFFADRKRRADLIVIASLLLLALALYLVIGATRSEGGAVVVRVDGVETERHALTDDGVYPLNGGSNILVISEGQAWLSEANCPDLLCVKQGRIHYTGQSIVCLPNRLTVTVEGGESDGVDFVVG